MVRTLWRLRSCVRYASSRVEREQERKEKKKLQLLSLSQPVPLASQAPKPRHAWPQLPFFPCASKHFQLSVKASSPYRIAHANKYPQQINHTPFFAPPTKKEDGSRRENQQRCLQCGYQIRRVRFPFYFHAHLSSSHPCVFSLRGLGCWLAQFCEMRGFAPGVENKIHKMLTDVCVL